MPVLFDLSASLRARHLQPRIGFRPSFSHSRFDASGPVADLALGDQREQLLAIACGPQASRVPLGPELNRVLEAQAPRVDAGVAGGVRHE